jgi:hypothetical protein
MKKLWKDFELWKYVKDLSSLSPELSPPPPLSPPPLDVNQ